MATFASGDQLRSQNRGHFNVQHDSQSDHDYCDSFSRQEVLHWNKAADGAANTTTAETWFGSVVATDCAARGRKITVTPAGALTADDTNYAQFVVKAYTAGTGRTIGTFTTKTTASGGTGNWVTGTRLSFTTTPFALAAGDTVSVTITKPGSGVQLPQLVLEIPLEVL